jgi:hypothetical protein
MVNLRAVANNQTKAINPNFAATLFISTGFTTVNFKQVPAYTQLPVMAEVQAMTTKDLRQIDALNIQGAEKVIYLNGSVLAVNRIKQAGGDLIVFAPGTLPEGDTWLVVANLEQWSGATWCKVAVKLQDDIPDP